MLAYNTYVRPFDRTASFETFTLAARDCYATRTRACLSRRERNSSPRLIFQTLVHTCSWRILFPRQRLGIRWRVQCLLLGWVMAFLTGWCSILFFCMLISYWIACKHCSAFFFGLSSKCLMSGLFVYGESEFLPVIFVAFVWS